MSFNPKFINRNQITDELKDIARDLPKKDDTRKRIIRLLINMKEPYQVNGNDNPLDDPFVADVAGTIELNQGITVRDLAKVLSDATGEEISTTKVRNAADMIPGLVKKPREDKKGMYGNKPNGLYLPPS